MSVMKFAILAAVAVLAVSAGRAKRAPLKVSVYYESHCPDSRDFIMKQLHPHFCKVQQYLNLNLVPFGKAYSSDQGFMCQHGPKECRGNTIHNCVLKRLDEPKAQVDYVNCAMYNPDQPGHIENTCVQESGVDKEQVKSCFTSQQGMKLMLDAEIETRTMTPGPKFVPTIVFDDAYNDDDQNQAFSDFESILCEKLVSRGYMDVCMNGVIINQQIC